MAFESPASILYDVNGNPMAVTGGITMPVSTSALVVAGITSTGVATYFRTETDGTTWVTGSVTALAAGTQTVTGTITVANTPTVVQGNAGSIAQSWYARMTDGSQVIGVNAAPIWITGSVSTAAGTQTVTGSVSVLNTVTVTGSVTVANSLTGSMTVSNTVTVRDAGNATSVITSVPGSITSVTVLASNSNRKGAAVYNDSNARLYLKLGATASTTSFTVLVFPNSYYELPAMYTGIVDGIWASASGNARVTEIT